MQWIISSDLLRPFSRILHHSLPKAVIHVRRHCFGRSRLEDVEFLILKITSIQGQDIYTKQVPLLSCFILVACAQMLAGKLGVPWARPRLEPDSRAVSSECLSFCCPCRIRLPTPVPTGEETSFKSAGQTPPLKSYFLSVESVVPLFKPAFIKAIPCLFSILLC